jgi:LmbE family N-acetylglucosaminyl deacetylase
MKNWIHSIFRSNWRPVAVPHHRLLGVDDDAIANVLSLCDGSRTLSEVSDISGTAMVQLISYMRHEMLVLWAEAPPAPATVSANNIIISPHLDDAALSLGGHMLQWKHQCLVMDIFSAVSWWRFPFGSPTDPRIQLVRDAEEDLMAKLVGCHVQKMGLSEAPLRGYTLENLFNAEISPRDTEVAETIRSRLQPFISDTLQQWFLPLGVGNHVDHRLARDTVLSALLQANVPPQRIRFYEDLFYAAQSPGIPDFSEFVPSHRLRLMDQTVIAVGNKTRLLQGYGSQLTWSQINMVTEYARRFSSRPVERCWALT